MASASKEEKRREGGVVEFGSWDRIHFPNFTFQNQIERINRNL